MLKFNKKKKIYAVDIFLRTMTVYKFHPITTQWEKQTKQFRVVRGLFIDEEEN